MAHAALGTKGGMMSLPLQGLSTTQLSAVLGGRTVLHDVNLQLPQSQWTCVVGPNGAGKSTLLRAVAGLIPYTGHVKWLGQDPQVMSRRNKAKTLSWLGQHEGVDSDLSVADVVMLGRLPHMGWLDMPTPHDRVVVDNALEALQARSYRDRRLSELSGGERQRVLLARIMAGQSPIMLMDEPLSHLDPPHQVDWLEQVKCLCLHGTTVLTVLHDIGLALHADHILVMQQGRVVGEGGRDDLGLHRVLESVFEDRITIRSVDREWVVLPRLVSTII